MGLQIAEPTDPLRPEAERGVIRTDVETTDYAIDATLHPDEHRIEGLERITFRNRSTAAIDQLAFHLYMNAFSAEDTAWMKEGRGSHRANGQGKTSPWGYIDVRTVRLVEDGTEIPMVLGVDPSVATVDLPSPLPPGETLVLDVAWHTHLPEVFARTGYAENFVMAAQWYPKLGVLERDGRWQNHVFTFHSEFYADFGHYRVILDVPSDWVVGATGIRTAEAEEGERTKLTYEAAHVHDFAWSASPDFIEHIAEHDGIRIRQLHTPQTLADAQAHLDAQIQALDSMQPRFGPYPWSTITMIHPPAQGLGAGGMEYPTLFTSSPLYELPPPVGWVVQQRLDGRFTTVHEFGHQYFQGLLASDEFSAPWLDEGMNTFSNSLVLDDADDGAWAIRVLGHELDVGDLLRLDMGQLDGVGVVDLPADGFRNADGLYGRVVYRKTAAVMRTLRNLVGHDAFDDAMRTYATRFRFTHPTPEDLIATLAAELTSDPASPGQVALGDDVQLDVRAWLQQGLRTPRGVAFAVRWVENRRVEGSGGFHRDDDGQWSETPVEDDRDVEGLIVLERSGSFATPVQVEVTFDDADPVRVWWSGDAPTLIRTFPGRRVRSVHIDPDRHLELESERYDNHRYARRSERPTTATSDLSDLTEALMHAAMLGVGP